ncbi:hypothetical protein GGF42_004877 [Coemansia sp. RSA 2424]|nr:hypothetical protein GGF42_004877 [Coemansia sp. RSA 2424]
MKLSILALAAISAAPASLAAVIPSFQQENYESIGFINNLVASLAKMQSASPQCQGDCQGSGGEVTAVSVEEPQQTQSVNQISVLIREFVHPFQQVMQSASIVAAQETPAIEMIYNYLNSPASFASPAAPSSTPSLVNRVEAEELSETAAPGWWFASVAAASKSAMGSSTPYSPAFAAIASTAAPQANEEEVGEMDNASVQSSGFDYNSWGQRIDNAALKLASNVEGIIVEFVPSAATVQALSGTEYEDAPEAAATTTAPFYWF